MTPAPYPINPNDNYYLWRPEHMRHLSVGALVLNDQQQILTLYLERIDGKYFLPTRSHAPNKTLEDSLQETSKRTGWQIELQDYLGVITSQFPTPNADGNVTKYTIWYLCKPTGQIDRDPEDRDADALIHWKTKVELGEIFGSQASVSSDADQRNVLALLTD